MRFLAYDWHTFEQQKGQYLRSYSREDPMELFWLLVVNRFYRECNGFGEEIFWLVDRGMFFTVETEVKDQFLTPLTEYTEYVRFWVKIPNPDDALLFKLTWGGK